MRKVLIVVVALGVLASHAFAQRNNTYYVDQFPGATVGAKANAAQSECNVNTAIPCIIVFDPILSGFATGSLPAQCAQCTWVDWRTPGVIPGGGAVAWGAITGTLANQTDLQTALDARSLTSHAHAWGVVTGTLSNQTDLQTALDARSLTSHAHAWGVVTGTLSNQTDLQTALDARSLTSHAHGFAAITGTATDAQIPNNITIDLAATANAGDSATAFFSSGTIENVRLDALVSLLGSTVGGAELDNPAVGTKGGVSSLTCSGSDKLSAINTSGTPVCSADSTSSGVNLKLIGSADYTNSTASFTDVTASTSSLTGAVLTGTTYSFTCTIMVSAAAATTGAQIAINGPTNSFLRYNVSYYTAATTTAVWSATTYDPTSAANGTYPVASAGTVITPYFLYGSVVTTAAGTFAVRARTEVATSAVTIYRGSHCELF